MTSPQQIIEQAVKAAAAFRELDQKRVDAIVRAVYLAALDARVKLARLANEETGLGVREHKVIKNVIAAQLVYEDIKNQRTVGVISEDPRGGMVELARPLGPIMGFIPVTNPTSTAIFKSLITMKTRNPLILSSSPAARRCTTATAQRCDDAALSAGAPEHCIQWFTKPTAHAVEEMLDSRHLALILATGTDKIVRRAHTSGTPAIGVGPGNVPVYIGVTADIAFAVRNIIESKTFDNGTVCASEQSVVVRRLLADAVIQEFQRCGAHFLTREEADKVAAIAYDPDARAMKATVVGQSVQVIARRAGICVPEDVVVLMARLDGVGVDHPLSAEILAPILGFYVEEDFETAIGRCSEITRFGGTGHTAVIYSNTDERVEYFAEKVDASRILVNMSSTFGALGGMYSSLNPSFTLGCGSGGRNITTDNITTRHLLNIHRLARRRPNPRWIAFDKARYLDDAVAAEQLEAEFNRNF
ncbi:MAG: aldehyde dehydrogenase family protein [Candidatus Riflebacteria bacterium]|nr:aldehyde dehydrogenase family protein [Candidatus Riflebacteria bacterium]